MCVGHKVLCGVECADVQVIAAEVETGADVLDVRDHVQEALPVAGGAVDFDVGIVVDGADERRAEGRGDHEFLRAIRGPAALVTDFDFADFHDVQVEIVEDASQFGEFVTGLRPGMDVLEGEADSVKSPLSRRPKLLHQLARPNAAIQRCKIQRQPVVSHRVPFPRPRRSARCRTPVAHTWITIVHPSYLCPRGWSRLFQDS